MRWVSVFILMCLAVPAYAIDCSKANTELEKAICGSPELIAVDAALNRAYQQALLLVKEKDKTAFKTSQKMWQRQLKEGFDQNHEVYPAAGVDIEYLRSEMEGRIRLLTGKPEFGPGTNGKIIPVLKGTDHPDGVDFVYDYQNVKFQNAKLRAELLFNEEMAKIDPGMEDAIAVNGDPVRPYMEGEAYAAASLIYASPNLVSAHVETSIYWKGQAHGWSDADNINIDMRNGEILAFDDLFPLDVSEKFKNICAAQGRDNPIVESEFLQGLIERISDLRSWSLRGDGATISFPPGSIGGYQQPIYECKIDVTELRKYVKVGFELW
jgi:hypothetical protein